MGRLVTFILLVMAASLLAVLVLQILKGKGGPLNCISGTVPKTRAIYMIAIEAANDGVGEPWPQAQTDSRYVIGSSTLRSLSSECWARRVRALIIVRHHVLTKD
jgi:hypothetical protein